MIVIIDPASTEFNRGSFCYLSYLVTSALREKGSDIIFYENFTVAEIDELTTHHPTDEFYVCLWSYPQIDACLILNRFLPRGRVHFFGYKPLIKSYGLPNINLDYLIEQGMASYPKHYPEYKYLLLSDCDMHLRKYDGQVYPLFTSYGCPNGCAFCPSTVNCNRQRISLSDSAWRTALKVCKEKGYTNIHFTDEDLFYNVSRARLILEYAAELGGFRFIALGSVSNVQKFIDDYGQDLLKASGVKLIEIGFETGDDVLSKKMGKPPTAMYERLAECCETDIFWLTMTFFPGETVTTLNKTGDFLRKYGFKLEEVYGRIATNGTEGGLGQFFQPYHGTKGYGSLAEEGLQISYRPIRLIPSYIPTSFLDCKLTKKREITEDDMKWFDLYHVDPPTEFEGGVWYAMGTITANKAIAYAICARLGVIQ